MLCLGRILQHPESNEAWKKRIEWIINEKSYRDYDGIDGEPTEFEWNIYPGFTTLQLCGKINDLLSDLGETPEIFTGRIQFMSMFNDISCDRKGNKEECLANTRVVKVLAKRSGVGQWSFIGPGSEKMWYSAENSPQGAWDHIADEMLLEFAESGHPTFRATTPMSRGQLKSKGHGKLSIHFTADYPTIETVFRIIISANQLSIYGAVATICEEFENHQDGSGELEVKLRQRFLYRMKTLQIIKFYGNSTWNELNHFHQKAKLVDSVWKQDLCVLLKWDSISLPRTLVILDNFVQWLVVNTLFTETIQLHNQKDGFKET